MSRDYQATKNNPYLLPRPLYRMTLAFIRDHERKCDEYKSLEEDSRHPPDGLPRGSASGNPTQRNGIRRAELWVSISAVKDALNIVPEEYRDGVWENVVHYRRYPDDADPSTYRRYKQRFIHQVAHNMLWI